MTTKPPPALETVTRYEAEAPMPRVHEHMECVCPKCMATRESARTSPRAHRRPR